MSVCPTVFVLHFYGCCYPCFMRINVRLSVSISKYVKLPYCMDVVILGVFEKSLVIFVLSMRYNFKQKLITKYASREKGKLNFCVVIQFLGLEAFVWRGLNSTPFIFNFSFKRKVKKKCFKFVFFLVAIHFGMVVTSFRVII